MFCKFVWYLLILANFGEGHVKHFNIARKQVSKGMFVQSF